MRERFIAEKTSMRSRIRERDHIAPSDTHLTPIALCEVAAGYVTLLSPKPGTKFRTEELARGYRDENEENDDSLHTRSIDGLRARTDDARLHGLRDHRGGRCRTA